jgi:phosphoserine phosphatase RsbU/P
MQSPHGLKCAETWAGNEGTSSVADLPGLRVWVHSRPFGTDDAGGDVHYLAVCPSCLVSRIALANVSGHGRAVVSLSGKLGELMHTHLAALEQASLMRDLNEAVITELDGVHYATMVAVGFHARRGLLVMTNAGHPPAFVYRANRREWRWFDETPGRRGLARQRHAAGALAEGFVQPHNHEAWSRRPHRAVFRWYFRSHEPCRY